MRRSPRAPRGIVGSRCPDHCGLCLLQWGHKDGSTAASQNTLARSSQSSHPATRVIRVCRGKGAGDAIGTGDATGEGNSSSTSVPLSFQTKPTILLIEISLVSMFMMDRPDSSNCWCDVQSRAPEIVAGLKPLRGIDTGSRGGRQSNTGSPHHLSRILFP